MAGGLPFVTDWTKRACASFGNLRRSKTTLPGLATISWPWQIRQYS
jgi:hypothetical protein